MKEHIFLGAYWSARKESRTECAQRVARFLQSISDNALFAAWYFRGQSKKAANRPLEISFEAIEKNLRSNNRDDDHSPIVELGFSIGAWNGGTDERAASFDVRCGSSSRFVGNSAVLALPPQEPPTSAETISAHKSLLRKMIDAWDPEFAALTSSEFLERAGGGTPADKGGWLVYRRGKGIEERKG